MISAFGFRDRGKHGDIVRTFRATRVFLAALSLYFAALALRTVTDGVVAGLDTAGWVGLAVAFALLASAAALATRRGLGDLSTPCAYGAAIAVVLAVAVTWGTAVGSSVTVLRPFTPMLSTAIVILVILMLRDRLVLALAVVAIDVAIGFALGPLTGAATWLSAVLPRVSFIALFIAGACVLLLGPQIAEMRALAVRRAADRRGVVALHVDIQEREERIRRIDKRVRPLLRKVTTGQRITDDDVVGARLIEAHLRDEIRGRALDVPRVRNAVWAARRRGVAVTVLDDGGLAGMTAQQADAVTNATARVLEDELLELPSGEVIARIAPPGREPVATVVVATESIRRRIELTADGIVGQVVET